MKIDDNTLIRFINNDLSGSEKNKIQLLINSNLKIRFRVEGLKNFKSILKEESKANKKIKMPKNLYEKISVEQNIEKNYFSNKFSNFYKIAAGILAFVSIGWVITMPNKAYLSQKNYLPNKNHQTSKIYYTKSERDQFLSKYNNCKAAKQKMFDENNEEVFPVICKID
jgi:hypothetical protein